MSHASPLSQQPPPPHEWRPPPPLKQRIVRAVSTPALAAAVVFVAVVLTAIAITWLSPHDAPASADFAEIEHASQGALNAPDSEPSTTGASITEDQPVFVHVVGEVEQPGVVELEAGARVSAAIEAAGGPTSAAVLAGVNLARPLVDGEQIVVPDTETAALLPLATGHSGDGTPDGLVNLNTADASTLETLPKVGPALAQRIIEWREGNGGFSSPEQLLDVSGIGSKIFELLRERVSV